MADNTELLLAQGDLATQTAVEDKISSLQQAKQEKVQSLGGNIDNRDPDKIAGDKIARDTLNAPLDYKSATLESMTDGDSFRTTGQDKEARLGGDPTVNGPEGWVDSKEVSHLKPDGTPWTGDANHRARIIKQANQMGIDLSKVPYEDAEKQVYRQGEIDKLEALYTAVGRPKNPDGTEWTPGPILYDPRTNPMILGDKENPLNIPVQIANGIGQSHNRNVQYLRSADGQHNLTADQARMGNTFVAHTKPSSGTGFDAAKIVNALKARESSGNYKSVNSHGYVGAYQFGAARLADMGLVKAGVTNRQLSDPSVWTGVGGATSLNAFLANDKLQDKVALKSVNNLAKQTRSGATSQADWYGKVMAAHLLGVNGSKDLTATDANHTSGQDYYNIGASLANGSTHPAESGDDAAITAALNDVKSNEERSASSLTENALKSGVSTLGAFMFDTVDTLFDTGAALAQAGYKDATGKDFKQDDFKDLGQVGFHVDKDGVLRHYWSWEKPNNDKNNIDSKQAIDNLIGTDNSLGHKETKAFQDDMEKIYNSDKEQSTLEVIGKTIKSMWKHKAALPAMAADSFVYFKTLTHMPVSVIANGANQILDDRIKSTGHSAGAKEVATAIVSSAVQQGLEFVGDKMSFGVGGGIGLVNKTLINKAFRLVPKGMEKAVGAGLLKTVLDKGIKPLAHVTGEAILAGTIEEAPTEAAQQAVTEITNNLYKNGYNLSDAVAMLDSKAQERIRRAGWTGLQMGFGQSAAGNAGHSAMRAGVQSMFKKKENPTPAPKGKTDQAKANDAINTVREIHAKVNDNQVVTMDDVHAIIAAHETIQAHSDADHGAKEGYKQAVQVVLNKVIAQIKDLPEDEISNYTLGSKKSDAIKTALFMGNTKMDDATRDKVKILARNSGLTEEFINKTFAQVEDEVTVGPRGYQSYEAAANALLEAGDTDGAMEVIKQLQSFGKSQEDYANTLSDEVDGFVEDAQKDAQNAVSSEKKPDGAIVYKYHSKISQLNGSPYVVSVVKQADGTTRVAKATEDIIALKRSNVKNIDNTIANVTAKAENSVSSKGDKEIATTEAPTNTTTEANTEAPVKATTETSTQSKEATHLESVAPKAVAFIDNMVKNKGIHPSKIISILNKTAKFRKASLDVRAAVRAYVDSLIMQANIDHANKHSSPERKKHLKAVEDAKKADKEHSTVETRRAVVSAKHILKEYDSDVKKEIKTGNELSGAASAARLENHTQNTAETQAAEDKAEKALADHDKKMDAFEGNEVKETKVPNKVGNSDKVEQTKSVEETSETTEEPTETEHERLVREVDEAEKAKETNSTAKTIVALTKAKVALETFNKKAKTAQEATDPLEGSSVPGAAGLFEYSGSRENFEVHKKSSPGFKRLADKIKLIVNTIYGGKGSVSLDVAVGDSPAMIFVQGTRDNKVWSEAFTDAATYQILQLMATQLSTIGVEDTASVLAALGVDSKLAVPTPVMDEFIKAGKLESAIASSIGAGLMKSLGIRAKGNASKDLEARLAADLGGMLLQVLVKGGYLEEHQEMSAEQLTRMRDIVTLVSDPVLEVPTDNPAAMKPGEHPLTTYKFNKAKLKDVVANSKLYNEMNTLIGNKGTGELRDSPKSGSRKVQTRRAEDVTTTSPTAAKAINKAENTPFYAATVAAKVLLGLWHTDESGVTDRNAPMSALKQFVAKSFGYKNPQEYHKNFERDIEQANEVILTKLDAVTSYLKGDIEKPVYFDYFLSMNGRVFMDSTVLNPQTGKIERFIVTPGEEKAVTPETLDMFKIAVVQAFDGGQVENTGPEVTAGGETLRDIGSIDKQSDQTSIAEFDAIYKKHAALIDALSKGKGGSSRQWWNAINGVDHPTHTILAITEMAKYKANGEKAGFSSKMVVETDGVTSGVFLGTLLAPVDSWEVVQEKLNQGAMFFGTERPATFGAWKEDKANKDAYESGEAAVNDLLENPKPRFKESEESITARIARNKIITKLIKVNRSFLKSPLMVFFYGAGMKGIKNDISEASVEDVMNRLSNPNNKNWAQDKALVVKVMKGFQEAGWINYIRKSENASRLMQSLQSNIKKFESMSREEMRNSDFNKMFTAMGWAAKALEWQITDAHGDAVAGYLNDRYGASKEIQTATNMVFAGMFGQFAKTLKEKLKGIKNPTKEQYESAVQDLLKAGKVPGILTVDATNKDQKVAVISKRRKGSKDTVKVAQHGKFKGGRTQRVLHPLVYEYVSNPAAGAVSIIHFFDSAVIQRLVIASKGLGVHDAWVSHVNDAVSNGKMYNTTIWKLAKEFDMIGEVMKAYHETITTDGKLDEEKLQTFTDALVTDEYNKKFNTKVDEAGQVVPKFVFAKATVNRIGATFSQYWGIAAENREKIAKADFAIHQMAGPSGIEYIHEGGSDDFSQDYRNRQDEFRELSEGFMADHVYSTAEDSLFGGQYNLGSKAEDLYVGDQNAYRMPSNMFENHTVEDNRVVHTKAEIDHLNNGGEIESGGRRNGTIRSWITNNGVDSFGVNWRSKTGKVYTKIVNHVTVGGTNIKDFVDYQLNSKQGRRALGSKEVVGHGVTGKMKTLATELNDLSGNPTSAEHMKYLLELVDSLKEDNFNKIKQFIQTNATDTIGSVTENSLDVNINRAKKQAANTQGGGEVYVHEIVHTYIAHAMRLAGHGAERLRREVRELRDVVIKNLNEEYKGEGWKVFLPKVSINGVNEEANAKAAYAYVFQNSSTDSLDEFVTYGLTNPELMNKIKAIKMGKKAKQSNLFEVLVNALNFVLDTIAGKTPWAVSNKTAYEELTRLTNSLGDINNDAIVARNEKQNALVRFGEYFDNLESGASKKIKKWIHKHTHEWNYIIPSKGTTKWDYAKWAAAIIPRLIFDHKLSHVVPEMLANFGINHTGTVQNVMRDFRKPSELRKAIDKLHMQADRIDRFRENTVIAVRDSISNGFSRELTDDEDVALKRVILDNDVQSIYKDYDKDKLLDMLTDKSKLEAEIKRIEAELDKGSHSNWNKLQSKGLGYFMATGKRTEVQAYNAATIVKQNTAKFRVKADVKTMGLVDTLATLYGLSYTNETDKATVANLVSKEYKGVNNILATHTAFVTRSKEELFTDSENGMVKGYTKSLYNDSIEIKLEDKRMRGKLEAQGYEFIKEIEHHGDIALKGRAIYRSKLFNRQEYYRAATKLTQSMSKGMTLSDLTKADGTKATFEQRKINKLQVDLRRLKQAKAMREGRFDPTTASEGFSSVLGDNGNVEDYRLSLDKDTRRELYEQDENASHALARSIGNIYDRVATKTHNNEVYELLRQDMENNYNKDTQRSINEKKYLKLQEGSKDKRVQRIWRMLTTDMKSKINKENGAYLAVQAEVLYNAFGFRMFSLANNSVANLLPNMLRSVLKSMEVAWQGLVSVAKVNILIRLPFVMIGNVISNIVYALSTDTSPVEVVKYYAEESKNIVEYIKKHKRLLELQNAERTGNILKVDTSDIARLESDLQSNPIHELFESGIYEAITEDMNKRDDKIRDKVNSSVQSFLKGKPKFLQTGWDWFNLNKRTAYYQNFELMFRMGDLIAQAVANRKRKELQQKSLKKAYLNNIKKGDSVAVAKKKSIASEERMTKQRLEKLSYDFVFYGAPSSVAEEYLNSVGAFMFTKYTKRIQRVIGQTVVDHPLKSALTIAIDEYAFNDKLDTIFDASLIDKYVDGHLTSFMPGISDILKESVPLPLRLIP